MDPSQSLLMVYSFPIPWAEVFAEAEERVKQPPAQAQRPVQCAVLSCIMKHVHPQPIRDIAKP